MSEKYIATNVCYFGCQLVETFVVQLRFTFGPNAPLPRDRCAPFLGVTHLFTSTNRVPASAGVRAGMSPLPGGR